MGEPSPQSSPYRIVAIHTDGLRVVLAKGLPKETAEHMLSKLSLPGPGWSHAIEVDDGQSDVVER